MVKEQWRYGLVCLKWLCLYRVLWWYLSLLVTKREHRFHPHILWDRHKKESFYICLVFSILESKWESDQLRVRWKQYTDMILSSHVFFSLTLFLFSCLWFLFVGTSSISRNFIYLYCTWNRAGKNTFVYVLGGEHTYSGWPS